MSYFVAPFEVRSEALPTPAQVHFVHLMSGIATRHSDTIDCFFRVDGRTVIVAISCATLTALREHEQKYLNDQQLVDIAALHLRRTLERGYDATQAELPLGGEEFRRLALEQGRM
jgi:hypothetical protein